MFPVEVGMETVITVGASLTAMSPSARTQEHTVDTASERVDLTDSVLSLVAPTAEEVSEEKEENRAYRPIATAKLFLPESIFCGAIFFTEAHHKRYGYNGNSEKTNRR